MGIPNRGPQITAVTLLFLILSWIVVSTRYYVRISVTNNFFIDDALAGVCLILFTAYGAVGIAGVYWGVGRHVWDVSAHDLKLAMKVWYFCEIVYSITAGAMRLTVGIFLLRIVSRPIHRYIIHFFNAVGVLFTACFLATVVFQCVPLDYYWERVDGTITGLCFGGNLSVKITLASSVIATVTDWTFGLLPIWVLWTVHLSKQDKFVVCFLLALIMLASTAPIIRIPFLARLMSNIDFLWASTDVAIWSVVELGIGLIVISLPSVRILFRRLFPEQSGYATGRTYNNTPEANQLSSKESSGKSNTAQRSNARSESTLSPNKSRPHRAFETFLSDSSTQRDLESNVEEIVQINWNGDHWDQEAAMNHQ